MSDQQGVDIVISCAISQDLEAYPVLIQEMQSQFAESWGGLEIQDAISVLNSTHALHMQSLVMALSVNDEQHIDFIVEIIQLAKSKNIKTVLVTRDLSASALHSLMRSGADDFLPYPMPAGALNASLAQNNTVLAPTPVPTPTAPPMVQPVEQVQPTAPTIANDSLQAPVADSVAHNFVQSERTTEPEALQQPVANPPVTTQDITPQVAQMQQPAAAPEQTAPAAPTLVEQAAQAVAAPSVAPAVTSLPKSGVIFPVFGVAGGVGASTFAANLAWELQSVLGSEGRVCLLDFGFQFGSVGTYLDTPRTDMTLELYSSIDIADADAFTSALSMYKDTLAVLAAPPEAVPLDIMGPARVAKMLDLAASQFDYVIVDLPNTLMSWSETVLEKSHLMFALAEMDMRSAQNALRFLRALKADDLPYEKVQFILNRAPKMTDLNGRSRVKRMADSLNIEFRWSLPDGGKHVLNSCDQGMPLAATAARNPLRKDMRKIAENLVALSATDAKAKARA